MHATAYDSRCWMFTPVLLIISSLSPEQAMSQVREDFVPLFNGTSTAGWRGYGSDTVPDGWVVDNGTLYRRSGSGDLMTERKFQDFELEFEWKISRGGNSGVMYRVKEGPDPSYFTGPEYQILDDAQHPDGQNDSTTAASLYGLYAPAKKVAKPAGEWNQGRIIVQGNHVQHWLNGELVVDCEMWSDDWQARYNRSKFVEWKEYARLPSGHIVLQDHGNPVWYRNLRIKNLTQ